MTLWKRLSHLSSLDEGCEAANVVYERRKSWFGVIDCTLGTVRR